MDRFAYIISKQSEWRELYEAERRRYKVEKGRAENERVKAKRAELEKSGENKISTNSKCQRKRKRQSKDIIPLN